MIQKIYATKLYEVVIKQIKSMISQGLLKKGDMLPSEKSLMELTGVSRITVREALKVLANDGIIETKKGKGSFVIFDSEDELLGKGAMSSIKFIQENFEYSSQIRLMVEPEIARIAASIATDNDIRQLEDIIKDTRKAIDLGEDTVELFNQFHEVLYGFLQNPVLSDIYNNLIELENPSDAVATADETNNILKEETYSQHKKIFEAIKGHNGEFAYFYMKEHMLNVVTSYSKYFQKIQ